MPPFSALLLNNLVSGNWVGEIPYEKADSVIPEELHSSALKPKMTYSSHGDSSLSTTPASPSLIPLQPSNKTVSLSKSDIIWSQPLLTASLTAADEPLSIYANNSIIVNRKSRKQPSNSGYLILESAKSSALLPRDTQTDYPMSSPMIPTVVVTALRRPTMSSSPSRQNRMGSRMAVWLARQLLLNHNTIRFMVGSGLVPRQPASIEPLKLLVSDRLCN
ncbi:unnamed protein product [Protopolystoma xenopodis]|uniref:Uncharacterized protein n=1 Tax=Protopolystoma xenopodis TaxID=117903 RepID=A0A3S4ZXP9_9PLAT|nr:unnamed protein product [Protopolystoma xenopodis]